MDFNTIKQIFNLRDRKNLIMMVLIGFICLLIFFNLGSTLLWQDEAETALVAKTILKTGLPQISDGRNFFYQTGSEKGAVGSLWAWTPWMQFYLAALSFQLFGTSEFAARLPFAFAGFLAVLALARFTIRIFGKETCIFALGFISASIPFFLYVRQCRYYSLIIFTTVLLLIAIEGLLSARKGSVWLFIAALFFMFHSSYLNWVGALIGISFAMVFSRRTAYGRRIQVVLWSAVSILIQIPWFFFFIPLHSKAEGHSLGFYISRLGGYLYEINCYLLPLLVITCIPLYLTLKKKVILITIEQKTTVVVSTCLIIGNLLAALLGPSFNLRYLIGALPLLLLLMAVFLKSLMERHKVAAALILFTMISTNIWSLPINAAFAQVIPYAKRSPRLQVESLPLNYLKELVKPPQGPIKAIVDFLKTHAAPSDVVLMSYGRYPVIFYTNLRVIGGMSHDALEQIHEAKWVIPRKMILSNFDAFVNLFILETLDWSHYERIRLPQTEFPWENIPEPRFHQFQTVSLGEEWNVEVYQKAPEETAAFELPSLFFIVDPRILIPNRNVLRQEFNEFLPKIHELQAQAQNLRRQSNSPL